MLKLTTITERTQTIRTRDFSTSRDVREFLRSEAVGMDERHIDKLTDMKFGEKVKKTKFSGAAFMLTTLSLLLMFCGQADARGVSTHHAKSAHHHTRLAR